MKEKKNNRKFNIRKTTSYHQYYFGYKKTYPTHDEHQQERWRRLADYHNVFEDGVYKE